MLPIEMWSFTTCQEELAAVLILPRVGHTQQPWASVLCDKVLIWKMPIINTHHACAITLESKFTTFILLLSLKPTLSIPSTPHRLSHPSVGGTACEVARRKGMQTFSV